jgi:hypothetical protein
LAGGAEGAPGAGGGRGAPLGMPLERGGTTAWARLLTVLRGWDGGGERGGEAERRT